MPNTEQRRERAIPRIAALLKARSSPRLQMTLFLIFTALAGVLSSVVLHACGVNSTVIRYPLAVGLSYIAFLLLISAYVSYHLQRRKVARASITNSFIPDFGNVTVPQFPTFHSKSPSMSTSSTGVGGIDFGGVDGLGAIIVIAAALLAIGSGLFVSILFVVQAPVLFAEVLFDSVLLLGLARRFNQQSSPNWVFGIIRKTILPVTAVVLTFALAGLAIENLTPGATTMGQAWHMAFTAASSN